MKKRQMRNGEITHLPFLCCGNKNQSFLSTPLEPDGLDRILDCAEPAALAGMDVAMIPGEEENIRIVTPIDLERFKLFLNAHVR